MIDKNKLFNKTIILYTIFGVLTTLINIAAYSVCYEFIKIPNVPSNIIAWVIAVAFAFVTNKIYVFESKDNSLKNLTKEIVSFTLARVTTGLLDLAIMFVAVDVLAQSAILFKVISNVIVIIMNYIFSKLFVFKRKDEK